MGVLKLLLAFTAAAAALALPTLVPEDSAAPNFVLRYDNETLERRQSINYNQDYTTGGSISYTHSGNSFSATWNNPQDFVVGIGWNPGNAK